jgi:hypothetical protein
VAQQADPDPRGRRRLLPRPEQRTVRAGPGLLGRPSVTDAVREAIRTVSKPAWQVASTADGGVREHADVVDITGRLDLSSWTTTCPGMRVIVRRELPHPGATLDAFEIRDGFHYQAFTTDTSRGQIAFLDTRHRAHVRVEDWVRTGKDTGLGHLPTACVPGRRS